MFLSSGPASLLRSSPVRIRFCFSKCVCVLSFVRFGHLDEVTSRFLLKSPHLDLKKWMHQIPFARPVNCDPSTTMNAVVQRSHVVDPLYLSQSRQLLLRVRTS
jgi:hypothetical protein